MKIQPRERKWNESLIRKNWTWKLLFSLIPFVSVFILREEILKIENHWKAFVGRLYGGKSREGNYNDEGGIIFKAEKNLYTKKDETFFCSFLV